MPVKLSCKARKTPLDRGSGISTSILRIARSSGCEDSGEPLVDVVSDGLALAVDIVRGPLMTDVSLEEWSARRPARLHKHFGKLAA
jgi:hypothetical protein